MAEVSEIQLTQTYGDHGLRFAGPDLLDCTMIFEIKGGEYNGERFKIDSSYHPCCGTLEVNAGLMKVYRRWGNKMDGCKQHRREESGDKRLRDMVWDINRINNCRLEI